LSVPFRQLFQAHPDRPAAVLTERSAAGAPGSKSINTRLVWGAGEVAQRVKYIIIDFDPGNHILVVGV
jgi:hypothetical protein